MINSTFIFLISLKSMTRAEVMPQKPIKSKTGELHMLSTARLLLTITKTDAKVLPKTETKHFSLQCVSTFARKEYKLCAKTFFALFGEI